MKTPHKHAEVIKAWADGAQIQCRSAGATEWHDVEHPSWLEHAEYRTKPKPCKGWYRVALIKGGISTVADEATERLLQDGRAFIRWLTPRTEYEVGVE